VRNHSTDRAQGHRLRLVDPVGRRALDAGCS